MEDVKELLEDAALEIYVEVFENLGYDSLDHLLEMGPSALLDLKRLAKMKEGHFVRLQTTINNWSVHAPKSINGPNGRNGPKSSRKVIVEDVQNLERGPHCFFELFDRSRRIGDAEQQQKWAEAQNRGMSFGTIQEVPGI